MLQYLQRTVSVLYNILVWILIGFYFLLSRSKTWHWRPRELTGPATRVQHRQFRNGRRVTLIRILRRRSSGGLTDGQGARIRGQGRAGCGGRKWRRGWRGYRVGKRRRRRRVGGEWRRRWWCWWRRRSRKSGLHRWSLVFSSPSFRFHVAVTILSAFGSGT